MKIVVPFQGGVPLLSIFLLLCLFLLNGNPAMADQNDPELDTLFKALKATTNEGKAAQLQQEIWARWTTFGSDERINHKMQVGMKLMNAGALRDAEHWFGTLAEATPTFAEVWNKRATIRFMIGDLSGSKRDIARVLQLEPRHFGALSGLGMIHAQQGNYEAALLAYQAAARQNPHLKQVDNIITSLKKHLRGEEL
tara:strand:+ start:399 stop:986 length:588 start_codon:yes stop_codon:yes gene_type:complete